MTNSLNSDDADKVDSHPEAEVRTDRALQRAQEDDRYVPVIVKRTDEARRHPDDILEVAIEEGLEQLERPPLSLFLSSIAAGLILGFTAMSVGVTTIALEGLESTLPLRIAVALVYPLGFVVCMMSGTELFTEHTATAVYPVLDRKAFFSAMVRLWVIVLAGNLLGTLISAGLLTLAEDVVGAAEGYRIVASHLMEFATVPLLLSALLAGWLMALGAWLILATPPTVSQLASIYVVTFLIGLGGLHHSIAGSAEALTGYLTSNEFTIVEVLRFILLAAIGNLIGGSLFVAVLNYGHIRKSREIS
jgi:formate/nitrite transporter FocA (FNT family)